MHPATRFRAPDALRAGSELRSVISPRLLALIGESFAAAVPGFAAGAFVRSAQRGLAPLALMARAAHVAAALRAQLPADPATALASIVASLGPPLARTEGNGLAPFFYLPHSALVAELAVAAPAAGLAACRELTRRFTAEFAIRPLLRAQPDACWATLARWCGDGDAHVRRLVSEGSRPRLPWGGHLDHVRRDPAPTLALLERLKDDPERYVVRSVANHLGDILKDHPALGLAVARRWLDEVAGRDDARAQERRWLVRHAVRLPAKRGAAAALAVRRAAGG